MIEFYYNGRQNGVKPYNPVKPVHGVKRMIHYPILERDAPIVKNSYSQVSKLKRGDAFRIEEKYYVVVGNDYFEEEERRNKKAIPTPKNQYKEFYQNKMRPRR